MPTLIKMDTLSKNSTLSSKTSNIQQLTASSREIQELFEGIDFEDDGSWIASQKEAASTNQLLRTDKTATTARKDRASQSRGHSSKRTTDGERSLSADLDGTFLNDEEIAKLGLPKKKDRSVEAGTTKNSRFVSKQMDVSDARACLDQSEALLDESRNLLDVTNHLIDDKSMGSVGHVSSKRQQRIECDTPEDLDISSLSLTSTIESPAHTTCMRREASQRSNDVLAAKDDSLSLNESMMQRYGAAVIALQSPEDNNVGLQSCVVEHKSDLNLSAGARRAALTFASLGPPIEPFKRKVGPNEEAYKKKFAQTVSGIVAKFRHDRPGLCVDFNSLSSQRRDEEKRKVKHLISQLTVGGSEAKDDHTFSMACVMSRDYSTMCHAVALMPSLEEAVSPIVPAVDESPIRTGAFDYGINQPTTANRTTDSSMTSFSPPPSQIYTTPQQSLKASNAVEERAAGTENDDGGSISSVEQVRQNRQLVDSNSFASPDSTIRISQKRCATSSGRKGGDTSRFRVGHVDDFAPFDDDGSDLRPSEMIPSPATPEECSYVSPPRHADAFSASQSPISHRKSNLSRCGGTRIEMPESASRGSSRNLADDTIETNTRSLNLEKRVRWDAETHDSFLNEMPAKVSLKHGAHYRLNPLRFRKNTPGVSREAGWDASLCDFPDPLQQYSGRIRERMASVYSWIEQRDQNTNHDDIESSTNGIVFGLSPSQSMSISLKLIHNARSLHGRSGLGSTGSNGSDLIGGGTLVVARRKEDLDSWEKIFREGTSQTVITHATLPFTERTNPHAAAKCSTFDVVITTFDCLMSKDTAIRVDSFGRVVTKKPDFENGWYSSRSSDQSYVSEHRCEQLSILHSIQWRRVLFVDVLGRKSYLSKMGTLRAKAAFALHGRSRFIFFEASVDDGKRKNQLELLHKSDKRALRSVAAILRFPSECGLDYLAAQSTNIR